MICCSLCLHNSFDITRIPGTVVSRPAAAPDNTVTDLSYCQVVPLIRFYTEHGTENARETPFILTPPLE